MKVAGRDGDFDKAKAELVRAAAPGLEELVEKATGADEPVELKVVGVLGVEGGVVVEKCPLGSVAEQCEKGKKEQNMQ